MNEPVFGRGDIEVGALWPVVSAREGEARIAHLARALRGSETTIPIPSTSCPIAYALGRISAQRNAARARLAEAGKT